MPNSRRWWSAMPPLTESSLKIEMDMPDKRPGNSTIKLYPRSKTAPRTIGDGEIRRPRKRSPAKAEARRNLRQGPWTAVET